MSAISSDPIVRSLLLKWAQKPWVDLLRLQLADRLEEIGESERANTLRMEPFIMNTLFAALWAALPRRARQRNLKAWQTCLVNLFGDFRCDQHTTCVTGADTHITTEPPF